MSASFRENFLQRIRERDKIAKAETAAREKEQLKKLELEGPPWEDSPMVSLFVLPPPRTQSISDDDPPIRLPAEMTGEMRRRTLGKHLMAFPQAIPSTYVIWRENSTYYAFNATTGKIPYSGTDAATVIDNAWGDMTEGGTIYLKGAINLGTSSISFSLTKDSEAAPVGLSLMGEGSSKTRITYTGEGDAITITTDDAAPGYYYCYLSDFLLDGSSKTSGRNGIAINDVGKFVIIERVKVYNMDVGINIGKDPNDTNEVYLYNVDVVTANTGIKTSPQATNEISFTNCRVVDTTDYGYYLNGGNAMRLYGGAIRPTSGVGLYAYITWTLNVDGVYFHHADASYTCDAQITGVNATFQAKSVIFKCCYFNGGGYADYAIDLGFVDAITIDTCKSRLHNDAFIRFANTSQDILIINPFFEETYLLDTSATQTQALARFAGTVIEPRRIGFIAMNSDATTCDAGDVMVPSGTGAWRHTTTINDDVPAVVMYGQAQDKPIVLCMKGITDVEMEASTTLDDTVVSSNTDTKGEVNNSQTDPKKIIGYVVEAIGSAGKGLVKIL